YRLVKTVRFVDQMTVLIAAGDQKDRPADFQSIEKMKLDLLGHLARLQQAHRTRDGPTDAACHHGRQRIGVVHLEPVRSAHIDTPQEAFDLYAQMRLAVEAHHWLRQGQLPNFLRRSHTASRLPRCDEKEMLGEQPVPSYA